MLASTRTGNAAQKITSIVESWFRSKHFDDLPHSGEEVRNDRGYTLQFQQRNLEGGATALRWDFKEQWTKARWQEEGLDQTAKTRITVVFNENSAWFLADIHPPLEQGRYGDKPRETTTPAFVQPLLNAVDFYDGDTLLSPGQSLARTAEELDLVLNAIQDETRHGMVLVTTPPLGDSPEAWQETLHEILKGTQGLTRVHMISHEKLDAFNAWTGSAHSLPPGSIRTYKSGVDLDNRLDGFVHRIMQRHRILTEQPRRLNRVLRRSLISELAGAELPEALRAAEAEFRKIVRHHQVPSDLELSQETVSLRDENSELLELLAESDKEYVQLRNQFEYTEKHNKDLLSDNDLLTLELSSVQDALDRILTEHRVLQRKLWNNGDQSVYATPASTIEPASPAQSFSELLERIDEFPGVLFSGDHETTKELDEFSDLGVSVVQKTWEVLRTFDEYAKARIEEEFEGGIFQYQRKPEHGHYMRIRQISAHESDTVQQNQRMREQRIFSVPTEVDPTGQLLMYPHVPLATGRGRSPRLHFEDTWLINKKVTVGYIGPHLDNKSTN
ncbi:hypothetical protein [Glutamicibacter halophytocola]|uniref:hypothetical protein n=1 Tax=Glutamicibacter halophytocola TaxID=1933880 RepID=UPI0015C57817|nr:hypothetical protein [Glutamicibacter halophytocola]NQD40625.1 hypothetical protein [Glutamicibacter halophytocola]